ncbi:MAG TPA: hypothetical protein VEA60_13150 [Allosphingosinicella sp.]|nr:hypothetical protein [Allosphingosinicella sp.]
MTVDDRRGLERYNDLYLWMIIPMAIMQAGIFRDYWGDRTDNAWAVHIHYWTATLWYVFRLLQASAVPGTCIGGARHVGFFLGAWHQRRP